MRRDLGYVRTACAVFALTMTAGQVSAAPLANISYDVTGGTFSGPNSTGPVTGGTFRFTPTAVHPYMTNPPYSIVYYGTVRMVLTGPSGYFDIQAPVVTGSIFAMVGGAFRSMGGFPIIGVSGTTPPFGGTVTLFSGGFQALYRTDLVLGSVHSARVVVRGTTAPGPIAFATHYFTIGNEVRTPIPEPGTAGLLGLGLLGLTGFASACARARRSRRH
jgi:hypothetical protein